MTMPSLVEAALAVVENGDHSFVGGASPSARSQLREWLGCDRCNHTIQVWLDFLDLCNGAVGEGVFFGWRPEDPDFDLRVAQDNYRQVLRHGEIAIANDGFGNPYVVRVGVEGVWMCEALDSTGGARILVASRFDIFLFGFFTEPEGWPYEREVVLVLDPDAVAMEAGCSVAWDDSTE